MMCGKGGVPYTQKFLGGCIIVMIIIIIILAVFINFSGASEAKVELSGDNAQCKKRGLYFSNLIACQGEPLREKCIF